MSLQPYENGNVGGQVDESIVEVINPIWSTIADPAIVDNSITMQEYRPINDSTSNQNFLSDYQPKESIVRFTLANTSNYLHLSQAKLITTMRLVRDGGVDIVYEVDPDTGEEDGTNSDVVALSNLISTNIFDGARLSIGDRDVQSITHLDLASFVKVLTTVSCEEYSTKSAEMFLYAKGENQGDLSEDALEELKMSGTKVYRNKKYNRSFEERRKRSLPEVYYDTTDPDPDNHEWKVGKYYDVQTTIDLKYIFNMLEAFPNLILRNSKIDIEFKLTGNKKRLVDVIRKGDGYTGDYHVWIKDMRLFVPELQPNNAAKYELLKMYEEERSAKYIFNEPTVHLYNAHQANVSEIEWRITTINSKPQNVFILMKRSDRVNSYDQNFQIFDHANVSQISVNVGGEVYPRNTMRLDFENKKYNELYMRFLDLVRQTRANYIDEQSLVTYERFLDTYTIFWFDVSKVSETSYSEARDITLSVKFKDPSIRYEIYSIVEKQKTLFLSLDGTQVGGRISIAG